MDDSHEHISHHRMMIRDFRRRSYITLALSLPVLALSPLIQQFLGYSYTFEGAGILLFGFSTSIYFYGGWPFLSGQIQELKQKQPGMMTLIGLAITVAYVYSAAVTFGLEGSPFYWKLAALIAIMLAGHTGSKWHRSSALHMSLSTVIAAVNARLLKIKNKADTAV